MRVLVTGAGGMLGQDVARVASHAGHQVATRSKLELNLSDRNAVERLRTSGEMWDLVVNCAAYTQVDKAEEETMPAYFGNVVGPSLLAEVCQENGWPLAHISTDFVFDGRKGTPYTEDDEPHPLGVYGKTKLEGEREVAKRHARSYIIRTSWLYGPYGKCFPRTMINAFEAGKDLRVVADQIGTPTYTTDLAAIILALAESGADYGLYHAGGPEQMSWHEFASRTIAQWLNVTGKDLPMEIAAISTADWPTPARRPANSALANTKLEGLGVAAMRPTDETLRDFCRAVAQQA